MGMRQWSHPALQASRRTAWCTAVLLAAAMTAWGGSLPGLPAEGAQSLSIEGRLVNGARLDPVPRVKVALTGVRGPVATEITDSDGRFSFPGLPAGNYTLKFRLADGSQRTVAVELFDAPIRLQINLSDLAAGPKAKPVDTLLRVWALHVPPDAEKSYRAGLKALGKNDSGRALEHLRKAVEIYPDFAAAYAAMGSLFLLQKEDARAAEAFETALRIDENLSDACFGLGSLYSLQKRYAEAEALLLRAAMLNPEDWRIHAALGENYLRAGLNGKAEQSLRLAQELHLEAPRLHVLLINALVIQEKYPASLAEMDEYLRLFPDNRMAPQVRQKRDALREHLRVTSAAAH